MLILDFETHTSVNGAKDLLARLRNFAIARGWTSVSYRTSVTWASIGGGQYGWIAGDNDYLELFSSGYGSQSLRYRFKADPYDAQETHLLSGPIDPGYPNVETNTATSPELQHNWQSSGYRTISLPTSTFPQCWFFGNERYVLVVVKVSSNAVISFAFGTFDLLEELQGTAQAQCIWPGGTNTSLALAGFKWYNLESYEGNWYSAMSWQPAAASAAKVVWWEGAAQDETYYRLNLKIVRNDAQPHAGNFTRLPYAVCFNSFANQRPIIVPTVFLRNSSGLYFPAGTLPVGYLVYQGLTMGETVRYATEEYLAFPNLLQTYKYGFAVRVA